MEKDLVFFGESGLSSASANHIANIAKECIASLELELSQIKLFRTAVASIIDVNKERFITQGSTVEDLNKYDSTIRKISDLTSLIAWLREGIKAKESLINEVECMNLAKYCKQFGIEIPSAIPKSALTDDDIIAEFSVAKRNRYYTLSSIVVTYGRYIHPDGKLSKARKEYINNKANPCRVAGEGRDALIYTNYFDISLEDIDKVFMDLQSKYREAQSELNSIKYEIEETKNSRNRDILTANAEEYERNTNISDLARVKMDQYIKDQCEQISKFKIVIPNHLKEIYEYVKNK